MKKAHLVVTLKRKVLDPQGATILAALKNQGNRAVAEVRQGKFFELQLREGISEQEAKREVERLAREVFINPVLEEFRYQIVD
ncbi:MAG: phosphoribosylformylglycinamidine synthase subunit PurS [Acidobacteria bacterium]|nr:phosphoribosylformylglycinamidine synthase subunit PurS [Acidobacteriota bacterium]